MNHLLLQAHELDANHEFHVREARAQHLKDVLRVEVGQTLRAARLDCESGLAEVLALETNLVRLRYQPGPPCPLPAKKALLLALPRPKVLSRCIQHATALGYTNIALFRSYRVEKAHLDSARLSEERLLADVMLGLEQGRLVHQPKLEVFHRFRPFVEDLLPERILHLRAYVAHPGAVHSTQQLSPTAHPYALALGPEGGFVDFELELLAANGCQPIRGPEAPLRVESALSYFTGQLDWLHTGER
jgi:RsmE family RNA methyltransferase